MHSTACARSLHRADPWKEQRRGADLTKLVSRRADPEPRRMCLHFGQVLSYSAARGRSARVVHGPAHCRTRRVSRGMPTGATRSGTGCAYNAPSTVGVAHRVPVHRDITVTMENKFGQTPQLTHEEQIARLQQLCSDLQKALDVSEEQRLILRDMSRTAAELAESLEASKPDH